MILSTHADACAALLARELRARRSPVWHLHEDDVLNRLTVGWRPGDAAGSFLEVDGCRAGLDDVRGVFARAPSPVATDPRLTEKDRRYAAFEMEAVLLGLLNAMPGTVINRPVPGRRFRPLFRRGENLEAAVAAGFALPEVLYATGHERAVETLRGWGGSAWASLVTGEAPEAVRAGADGERRLEERFADTTVCLTRRPDGEERDVFVVCGAVFAGRPRGEGIVPAPIAPELDRATIELCARLELAFARVKVVVGADRPTLVDIDAYPDPSPCETAMRDAIVNRLADGLMGAV